MITVSNIIGGNPFRTDSIAKVTGQAKYAEDIRQADVWTLLVGRSPYFHARLLKLDTSRAENAPGVRKILTWQDIPGVNGFEYYSQEEPVLPAVGETLRMKGAPIFLLIAETPEQGHQALPLVDVELEVLPHVLSIDEALAPNAIHIAGDKNVLASFEIHYGEIDSAFAEASAVVDSHYTTAFLEHAYLERESLLGYLDEEGRITVVGGNHQPHNQQRYIAEVLGLPLEQVRVITPPTGGSFGGKQDPWPFVATALAVYHARHPVRLSYSRAESFEATPKRQPYQMHYRIGATANGDLKALFVRILADTGGYDSGGQYIPNYALTAGGGCYRWQAVDGLAQTIYTNGPKSGQFRGFGTSQATFGIECTLDELAETLGIDPLELRLRNALHDGDMTYLGYPAAETIGYQEVLEAVRPHYEQMLAEVQTFQSSNPIPTLRQGVGIAGMWYRFGKAGTLCIEAHAELALDGHFVLYCSAPDYGQGTNTVMSQIAADSMGVSREQIQLVNADTALVPNSDIQGASRATYFVGGAVRQAVQILRQEIFGVAAEMLDTPLQNLALQENEIVDMERPSHRLPLSEVAKEFERIGKARRVVGKFDLSHAFPRDPRAEYVPFFVTGAHVAKVQVDLETGFVQVLKMVAAHDVGKVVNPLDACGQIEGAILMGIGAALSEAYIPNLTNGFSTYLLPMIDRMPQIEVILVERASRFGPYGVKGLGEAAMLPSTPAVINAISRAIGKRIRSIPATPEKIFFALYGKNRS
ncbi:MAG: xanthine dehydrogenase family protein molybdopterin-binding subunit [Anaerolineales bacterium]|nr:xanthine dehydrogenase family protein molybdopterin-binding subunit [Anaerolineales bacterium]